MSWEQAARARAFDLVHRGTPGDVAFYRHVCAGAEAVLELGCGSGRILVELARAGLAVTGLDLDAARLERARAELQREGCTGARLVHGDMTRLALGERYDRVLIPYNALCALADDRAVLDCLRGAARHLRPGGSVWFDVYAVEDSLMDEPHGDAGDEEELELILSAVDAQGRVDVWEREHQHADPRRIDLIYRYELGGQAGEPTRAVDEIISHLLLPPVRLRALLAEAGLRIHQEYGDFDPAPLTEESPAFIVGAQREDA